VHKSSSHKNHFSCGRNSPMSLSGWRILAGRLVIPSVMKLSIYRHFSGVPMCTDGSVPLIHANTAFDFPCPPHPAATGRGEV